MFDVDNHKKKILEVGYKNKTIESKYKWNQLNLLEMQYLLGTNIRMPVLHMAKIYICLEETNERIN